MEITNQDLIEKAKQAAKLHKSSEDVRIGDVGCALITDKNNVYVGVSIDACCGVGFCAEHSAIASMVTNQEYNIKKIVAVLGNGTILPPCGRCRELMYQINDKNLDAKIIIEKNKIVKLSDLLPEIWQKKIH
ncbi:cytidine deaminase [Candidatus Woesearchaeota archaeon]|nr:cytidine deaminase [Candidatus Woesearchaeota archaeon]